MRKNRMKQIQMTLAVTLSILLLCACGRNDSDGRVIFTTGWKENEVFRIEDEICTTEELTLYLTTTQNQYEKVYGAQIWETEHNEVTLEENVKNTVLARIAQVKTMYLMARERELALTEEEDRRLTDAAASYFASLNEQEIALLGVTQELIWQMYQEYALAEKVYEAIIRDVNPEISDDEARIITVQQIFLPTSVTGEDGSRTAMTQSEKAEVYRDAVAIRELALDEEQNFEKLAEKYNKADQISCSFGKGEMDSAFEEAAFQLETNEISEIVACEEGYYIIKCVSTFNIEETDTNKMKLLEQRKKDAFEKEYDAFVDTLVRRLNEPVFEEIALIHDAQVTTDDFFEVYRAYMDQ